MNRISLWLIVFEKVAIMTIIFGNKINDSNTRPAEDNFNVLLKLFKMNPLRESKIYNTYSNSILLPSRQSNADQNNNSNESIRKKRKETRLKLKCIEKVIHESNMPKKRHLVKPDYEIDNAGPESFNSNNSLVAREIINLAEPTDLETNSILEHIQSDEIENQMYSDTTKPEVLVSTTDISTSMVNNFVYVLGSESEDNHIKQVYDNPDISVIILK